MSLVDYASSSDDEATELKGEEREDECGVEKRGEENGRGNENLKGQDLPSKQESRPSIPQHQKLGLSLNEHSKGSASSSTPVIEKLPDVSDLFSSPSISHLSNSSYHSSRVAAAMAENASRKREIQISTSVQRAKVPKGTLPPMRIVPDTSGGMLVPPQLHGRSNIVTEDIGKLFVQKRADSSC